ncbi:MAG: DUF4912 domain-containing protein [Clostridia bacterium]|nr:DUF4912 domain-containing protein [Clostridia bacterium]
MPRKAKDEKDLIEKKESKKKTTSTSKEKKDTVKKVSTTKKKNTTAAKKTTSKKTTSTKTKSTTRKKNDKKLDIVEYYDLPYRYNETIVKVLAQTPNILFVYWDISDEDKKNYIEKYGEFFFNDTKPVLIVHNDTLNYSFEIDINDYANSWYIHINDSNCDYRVELGRRPINKYAQIDNYLYISSSNEMDTPNDHILFDTLDKIVYFKNVKTNVTLSKDISLSFLTKLGKIYNAKEFYRNIYKDENINFDKLNLKNMPSS